jgi:hypothetical protein
MMFRIFIFISLNICVIFSNNINKRFLDEIAETEIKVTTTTPLPSQVEEVPATNTPLLVILPSTIPQTVPPLPTVLTTTAKTDAEVASTDSSIELPPSSDSPIVVPSSSDSPIVVPSSSDSPIVVPSSTAQPVVPSSTPAVVSTTPTTIISPVSSTIFTTTVASEPSSSTQAIVFSNSLPAQTESVKLSTTIPLIVSSTLPTSSPPQAETTTPPSTSTTTLWISTSNVVEPIFTTTTSIDDIISTTTSLQTEEVVLLTTLAAKIDESINENEKIETKIPNETESKDQDPLPNETKQIATTTSAANLIICFTKPISSSSSHKNYESYFEQLNMNPALVKFKNFTLNIIPSRVYDLMKHPSSDLILLIVLVVFIILIILLIITMCFVFRRRNYATTSLYKRFVENHLVINSSPLNELPPGETKSNYDNRTIITRIRTLKGDNNNEKNGNEVTNEQNIALITESPIQDDKNKKKPHKFLLNKNNNLKCQILDPTSSKAAVPEKDKCSDKIHLVKVKNNCFPKLSLFNINPIYVDDKTKIENTHL